MVRPLSRVAGRPCARPGCPSPARATLSFRYATREAWIEGLHGEPSPATYDLCGSHADRTRPPTGWGIVDQRPAEDQEPAEVAPPRELGDEHTVAVLAAALRAVPDRSSPPAGEVAPADEVVTAVEHGDEAPEDLVDDRPGPVSLDDLELPHDVRDGIEDALAELAAVSRRELDAAEQITIDLDDDAAADARADELADAPADEAADPPVPRPVRAARERLTGDGSGGPARAW